MRKQSIVIAGLVVLAGACFAHERQYSTTLSGPNEQPPNNSPGTGEVLVTIDLDLLTMRIQADFRDLQGNTSACHIHGLTANPGTGTAGVATTTPTFPSFPNGVTSGTYDRTFDMTLASTYNSAFITANGGTVSGAMNALIMGFDQGRTYFNVHTTAFPGGEIRGFLLPVPVCNPDLSGSSDPNDPAYGMPDGNVDSADFFYFLDQFVAGNNEVADLTGSSDPNDPTYGTPDGSIDAADFFYFLDQFVAGCP